MGRRRRAVAGAGRARRAGRGRALLLLRAAGGAPQPRPRRARPRIGDARVLFHVQGRVACQGRRAGPRSIRGALRGLCRGRRPGCPGGGRDLGGRALGCHDSDRHDAGLPGPHSLRDGDRGPLRREHRHDGHGVDRGGWRELRRSAHRACPHALQRGGLGRVPAVRPARAGADGQGAVPSLGRRDRDGEGPGPPRDHGADRRDGHRVLHPARRADASVREAVRKAARDARPGAGRGDAAPLSTS